MKLEAGDVILVPFPFTDLTASKTRPAFVLSRGEYNQDARDVIVCGMTSNLSNSANSVLVEQRDLNEGELKATSRVKVDKVVSLEKRLIRRRVGRVKPEVLYRALLELFNLFPDPHAAPR